MRKIPLTREQYAIVDDEDYAYLMQWKWYANISGRKTNKYYARRVIYFSDEQKKKKATVIHMHRALLVPPDGMFIDHINGDTLDNRRENLRICTHTENSRNKHVIWGKSKFRGVSWHKKSKKWSSYIRVDWKLKFIGDFTSEAAAALAYNEAAIKYFGEFAGLNKL